MKKNSVVMSCTRHPGRSHFVSLGEMHDLQEMQDDARETLLHLREEQGRSVKPRVIRFHAAQLAH